MDGPCRIRPATPADLEDVAGIERSAFPDPWPPAVFAAHLQDVFLVAADGEGLVGFLIARVLADDAEVLNVAVRPDARRRGTGTSLLLTAMEGMVARRLRRVFLEVRESNIAAREFYGGIGFAPVGRRKAYYRQPTEDALVLARILLPS